MNRNITTLPESAAIVGTKAHCSILSAPLGNYFGEGCIIHLANIFTTLSALLDWRIPPGRKVIAGFSQESGGLCQPPSSILRAIRPNINTDSILFDGGHLVERTDLVILFQYLTCELGWVGMDLRPTEQAGQAENPTDRNEPAALFACLKPDMIRVDKIVAWALRLRDQVILDSGMDQVDNVCSSLFLSHLNYLNHLRANGTYRRDGQAMSCTGPVTPAEFHNLRNGEFFHTRPSTPLPPPILNPVAQTPGLKLGSFVAAGENFPQGGHGGNQGGAVQAPHMVNPGGSVLAGVGVGSMDPTAQQIAASLQRRQVGSLLHGQSGVGGGSTEGSLPYNQSGNIATEEFVGHGHDSPICSTGKQEENVTQGNVLHGTIGGEVVGQVMVFKTLDDFNNHIEGFSQGRFTGQLLVPKSIEEFDLKMERLRFVFIESEGFVGCHLYTLVPLFHDKKSFRPHLLLKTLKDLQAESGVGQVVETNDIGNAKSAIFDINLLLRWARMAGHGISENNAARVTNLAARMDDIKTVMGRPGAVTREWSTPECQCLKYFMNCGCDEDLEPAETDIPAAESELDRQEWLDEYIRHAKGRLLEVTNDIKARLNSELETARNRMTGEIHEIMSGLHKAIDPAGHSALYPSTDPDDDSGHEEG